MNAVYAQPIDRRAMGVTAVLHVGAVAMFMNLEPMASIDGLPQALMVRLHVAEQVLAEEAPQITPPTRVVPLPRALPSAPPVLAVPEPSPLPVSVEAVSPKPAPEPTPVARESAPEPVRMEQPVVAEPVSAPSAAPATEPVKSAAPSMPAPAPVAIVPPRFDADYLHNPAPSYPPLSRRLREQGRVLLRVFVMPDGQPTQVDVRESSGFPRLDQAAQESVRRWRFVPARQGDKGVSAWVLVPISYSLRS